MKNSIISILALSLFMLFLTGCESTGSSVKGASQGAALGERVTLQGHISTSATTTKTKTK
jgi:hypothetical protein